MSLLKTNEIQNYNGSSLTLTASTVSTSAQLNTGGNISVTGSLNVSDDSTTRTNLGLGTIATQDSDSITVTGGTATLGALTVSGSDSGNLVRITQTGTGNALVVEDSANPDSTPFVVDASGNVGIRTSSPTNNLDIGFNDLGSGSIGFRSTTYANIARIVGSHDSGTAEGSLRFHTRTSGSEPERMRIDPSGNLLVGYTSSNGSYKLQVNSQIFATSSTIATSDGNYKENITPLDSVLFLVSQLNPVQFDWKEHPVHEFDRNQPTVGFIAQEVQKVLSDQPYVNSIVKSNECIIEPEEIDEEGNVIKEAITEEFLGIAEGNLVALLTKAIQEQQALIESQQSQIDALTAKTQEQDLTIASLISRIEALETPAE